MGGAFGGKETRSVFVSTAAALAASRLNRPVRINLDRDQAPEALSFELRKAFSGIVAGSIKAQGLAEIDAKGPFQISGDPKIMSAMSALLEKFVAQKRLKLPIENRRPCFEVVT